MSRLIRDQKIFGPIRGMWWRLRRVAGRDGEKGTRTVSIDDDESYSGS